MGYYEVMLYEERQARDVGEVDGHVFHSCILETE